MAQISVEEFFENEFPNFAIYNLYRMIASYVDGLKPSQRKVVYTVQKQKIKQPMKVNRLGSRVSEMTCYLHGEDNLQGVIVGMAQNFCGTNNLNILYPESSFGNRCFPEAAAARYIYTRAADVFDEVFHPADSDLLIKQEFEGDEIEPRFFVPTLPLVLINGSQGIGSGWSQKILPRDINEVKRAIKQYLTKGTLPKRIKPFFKNFQGSIENVNDNVWEICGIAKRVNSTTIEITEVPIGYTLDTYNKKLIDLEEKGEIEDYQDLSDPGENKFHFIVKVKRAWLKDKTDKEILESLKLVSRQTENFTCIDENNEVREFQNEIEVLKAYCDIRIEYYKQRKQKLLDDIDEKIKFAESKAYFVKQIVEKKIEPSQMKKNELEEYCESDENIVPKNGSYSYLLNMPIHIITMTSYNELIEEVKQLRNERVEVENTTENDMWIRDFENVK